MNVDRAFQSHNVHAKPYIGPSFFAELQFAEGKDKAKMIVALAISIIIPLGIFIIAIIEIVAAISRSEKYRANIEAAIAINGSKLKYAGKRWQNDRNIVLAAARARGWSTNSILKFASEELRNDRDLVLSVLESSRYNLKYVSENLQRDKQIVIRALRFSGLELQYASRELKGDREVALLAIRADSFAIKYVDESLYDDPEIIYDLSQSRRFINHLNPSCSKDRRLLLKIFTNNGMLLQSANTEAKQDKEIVLAAVRQDGRAIHFGSWFFYDDEDVSYEAVCGCGWIWAVLSDRLKNNLRIAIASSEMFPGVVREIYQMNQASNLLQNKILFALVLISNGSLLRYAGENIKDDEDLVSLAVSRSPEALQYASDRLKNDRSLIQSMASKNGSILEYASEELRNDSETVLWAVSDTIGALNFASDQLKNDRDFLLQAMRYSPRAIEYANINSQKAVVLAAIDLSIPEVLRWVPLELKSDREVVLAAINKNANNLEYASDALRNDEDVVLAAVQKDGFTFRYASEQLKDNDKFALKAVQMSIDSLSYVSFRLKQSMRFMEKVVSENGRAITHPLFNNYGRDTLILWTAIRSYPEAIKYADPQLLDDWTFLHWALVFNISVYDYLSDEIKEKFKGSINKIRGDKEERWM